MLRGRKAVRIGFLLAIILFVAGCAGQGFQPQQVTLAPRLLSVAVRIGGGAKVYITVADERGTNSYFLGYKADTHTFGRAEITTSDDIRIIYQKALSEGLANLGFNVVNGPDPAVPNLEVSLRRFLYMGFGPNFYVVQIRYVTAAATVRVRRRQTEAGGGQLVSVVREKSYEVYHYDNSRSVPNPGQVEERINAALSELMTKLLVDVELLTFLRATGPG